MKRTSKYIREAYLLSFVLLILTGFVMQPWGVRFNFEQPVLAQTTTPPTVEGTVFALTANGMLLSFNQFSPSAQILAPTAITGLNTGETVLGIDFRPRTGVLFGVTSASRVITINTTTAAATVVGTAAFTPAVNGTSFGVDFNPAVDRLRFVSDADQNLRLNPNDGTVAGTDTTLAYTPGDANAAANPNIVAEAYTNNFQGAPATTLYGIDSNLDILVTQGGLNGTPSPNGGLLITVGSLGTGIDTGPQVGFDIVKRTGLALASLTVPPTATTSTLYTINLTSGAATRIGPIAGGQIITDIAVVVPVETIFALTTTNGLLSFNAGAPGTPSAITPITGLGAGEMLLGFDFRPANGLLYAVSNLSNVYIINTATAAATPVSATPFTPIAAGANFGVDFNPVPDRIRFVSDADQDLRLNPNNGTVAGVDTTLAFATGDTNAAQNPNVVAAAYTSNFAGAATTTLYEIDSNLDILVTQGGLNGTPSPNLGQLTTIGSLTPTGGAAVDTGPEVGFDIVPFTDAAFASLTLGGVSTLATINLNNGAAQTIGPIGGGQPIRDIAILPNVEMVFAVTNSNKLISFVSTAPGVIQSTVQITGLRSETILGLDFRPANGTLFAIGSSSTIYTINPITGLATQVGPSPTNPQLNGIAYGFDFNPTVDRIRIASSATHNLRFVPDTGVAPTPNTPDTPLAYAATDIAAGQTPFVTGSAYDNNFAGSTSTTLYGIDTNRDALVTQGGPGGTPSPNGGQLFSIGALGVDSTENTGFDIAPFTNNAYASLTVGGVSNFYTINLGTGAATLVGPINVTEQIRGISVQTNTTPSAQPIGMAVANSASFFSDSIASSSLASVFGRFQTAGGQLTVATTTPLPTTLGGMSVMVNGQPAGLLMTSPFQLNIAVPDGIQPGQVLVMVTGSDGFVRGSRVNIAQTASGTFSVRSTGTGTAAALFTTGGGPLQPVFNSSLSEVPIPASTASSQSFLVLFATGVRNAPSSNPQNVAQSVVVSIGGMDVQSVFAGAQSNFVNLDQINVPIPAALAGRGSVPVIVKVNGVATNTTTVTIQ